jgi:two-component sensor histidine kinase
VVKSEVSSDGRSNGVQKDHRQSYWGHDMKSESSNKYDECGASQHTLLIEELQHRIRNLLTLVRFLIAKTQASTLAEYQNALSARVGNLADAYDLIGRLDGLPVSLACLLEQTLKPYIGASHDRIRATGPDIDLEPRLGLALHLMFHELATNACKHGALASSFGRVELVWSVDLNSPHHKLLIQWRESGGAEVREPQHRGFGLNLISKIMVDGEVDLRFEQSGLVCRVSQPL